jgi:hypothetical protein
MWFLLTGLSPAADDPGGLRTATSKLRGVPKIVRHLLERMVRPDPRERPQDPVALASYLQTCLARVERRAKMERRFGIPLTTLPRVAVPRIRRPIPLKPVALAAALLFLAALAVWSFPRQSANRRPLQSSARANRDAITSPDEINVPNEPQTVEKDSRERTDESGTSAPSAAVVAAPQPLHDELISIPPADAPAATAGTASQTDTFPTDQLTTSESGQVAAEPPPPAQGPAAKDDMEVADQKIVSREESSPNELTSAATLAPAPTAETNEPPAAAVASAPAQLADSSATAEAKADVTPIPRKTSLAKDATKARTKSLRDSSQTHLAKHRARPTHTVKRAQPVPQLRVGSAPAEFMGTTPKGNWILYVDDIGETIIVPPPPGYGP